MNSNSKVIDAKARSTLSSNIFSSVDNPDASFFLGAVAYFLNGLMISSTEDEGSKEDESLNSFFSDNLDKNQDKNILNIPKLPTSEDIHSFIESVYSQLKMNTEMLICSVIYIIRASENGVKLLPTNWRSILFISQVLSKKICDFAAIPEMHYSLLSELSGNMLSEGEIKIKEEKFLYAINYHATVKYSIYLRFFMELKNLLREEYFEEAAKILPMSIQNFETITEDTMNYEEALKKKLKTN